MSDLKRSAKKSQMKPQLKRLLRIGCWLIVIGPFLGTLITILEMKDAFDGFKKTEPISPEKLTSEIGTTIYPALGGITFGLIGLCVLIVVFFMWLLSRHHEPQKI
jgi:biopolymer transport protein ExbB/TolQ